VDKLVEDLTATGNEFHQLAVFRNNELKPMLLTKEISTFLNSHEACKVTNL